MNALSLFRSTEYIGAKELRLNLDRILRTKDHPYRVMLHNKPTVAILPDGQFIQLLEILEELKDSGLLERATRQLQEESKKKHPWFWTETWQKGEKEVNQEINSGGVKRVQSARALIKELNR